MVYIGCGRDDGIKLGASLFHQLLPAAINSIEALGVLGELNANISRANEDGLQVARDQGQGRVRQIQQGGWVHTR